MKPRNVVSTVRACHSLVRPASRPEALLEALPMAVVSRAELGPVRVWTARSDDDRAGRRATRLREKELRRPLAPGIGLRCVLLRHLDGCELVLVADRGLLPYCCLASLADIGAEALGDAEHAWKAHLDSPDHCAPRATRTKDLVTVVGGVCATVLRQEAITVVVEDSGAAADAFLVTRGGTVEPLPAIPENAEVGLIVTVASPSAYLPVLSPPYPITVIGFLEDGASVLVRTLTNADRITGGADEVIATQLARRLSSRSHVTGDREFLLEPDEIAHILRSGNGPELTVGDAASVPDAFLAVARTDPDRVAVTGEGAEFTYGELEELSRAAANALVASGVRAGDYVGVGMERTPRAVLALLAVLRAGACYVPLDMAHPVMRRSYVIADAALRMVIVDGHEGDQPAGVTTIQLDELLSRSVSAVLPQVGPDDPAYVIYTSGTTGDPKGTVIPHRNVLALIAATHTEFGLSTSDVWTLFHSLAFDFSVWEIWGCLLTGGRLVVVPYWTARTPALFARLLREQRITVLNQTPSAFTNLIPAAIGDNAPLDLRLVIFGGESLRAPTLTEWLRRFPQADCRLVNMYGITETTVHVTWHDVTPADIVSDSHSVGRALPGWSVSVRSADGAVVPFGVAGEICVSGAGLALGYHGRPELTAERFRTDPGSGIRYYRSGDLGRLRPDGTLEHLGRIDSQIKIRGYRVELGEIRAALLDDPAVRDAVVMFRENDEGGAIHAWVIARQTSVTQLRSRLRARLPDYMIPTELQIVAEFPLTPNGKVDVAALAASAGPGSPDCTDSASLAVSGSRVREPDISAAVNRVWADIFGPGCAEDGFFDLGGNSLYALKIALALDGLGDRPMAPLDVYLNPSVASLIEFLRGHRRYEHVEH